MPTDSEKCRLPGTPSGTQQQIAAYDTYVAQPEGGSSHPDIALVYFFDVFGFNLHNNKIIPDMLAKELGVTVYVPDVFHGKPLSEDLSEGMPSTAEGYRKLGVFQKMKLGAKMASAGPWFFSHLPPTTYKETTEFLSVLRTEKGHTKLGAVGYDYGGKAICNFTSSGEFIASVTCSPGGLDITDIMKIKTPFLIIVAEEEPPLGPDQQKKFQEMFEKNSVAASIRVYGGTVHGFANRPDQTEPGVKAAAEQAFADLVAFLRRHLVEA